MAITESEHPRSATTGHSPCRIFAPSREWVPPLHRVQISPFGAALSAAARQLTGSWSRPGLALDHERSGSHRCAQAVTVMATRPSR